MKIELKCQIGPNMDDFLLGSGRFLAHLGRTTETGPLTDLSLEPLDLFLQQPEPHHCLDEPESQIFRLSRVHW